MPQTNRDIVQSSRIRHSDWRPLELCNFPQLRYCWLPPAGSPTIQRSNINQVRGKEHSFVFFFLPVTFYAKNPFRKTGLGLCWAALSDQRGHIFILIRFFLFWLNKTINNCNHPTLEATRGVLVVGSVFCRVASLTSITPLLLLLWSLVEFYWLRRLAAQIGTGKRPTLRWLNNALSWDTANNTDLLHSGSALIGWKQAPQNN